MFKLTKTNQKNLRKLADYLMDNAEAIYADQAFDMSVYSVKEGIYVAPSEATCGSVCCAVGYGHQAGISAKGYFSWQTYIRDNFIKDWGKDWETDSNSLHPVYLWCFHDDWSDVDNTPYGAALRIYLLLDRPEDVPKNENFTTWKFFQKMKSEYYFKEAVEQWIKNAEAKLII